MKKKNPVKLLTKQVLSYHYFHEVQCFLGSEQKRKVLDIIADGKGIVSYEKIIGINSLSLTPENGDFFEKIEFYSDLKKKAFSDEEYESSLYLFKTLKMKNLGGMNDLYNAQDVIYFVIQLKMDFNICMNYMVLTLEGVILPQIKWLYRKRNV